MIPVSSVPCERGFSVQNRVKTKMRSRLTDTHIDNLMLIAIEAPNLLLMVMESYNAPVRTLHVDVVGSNVIRLTVTRNSTDLVSCTHFFQAPAFAARKLSEVFATPDK